MALPYDPNFTMAITIGGDTEIENDQEHGKLVTLEYTLLLFFFFLVPTLGLKQILI